MYKNTPLTNTDIIAIAAIVIAVISLIVALRQLYIQRRHNEKSVKPLAQILVGDYEDHLFVKLANYGLGPLMIVDSEFYNSDKTCKELTGHLPTNITYDTFIHLVEGRVVTAGNSVTLFSKTFRGEENDEAIKFELRNCLKDIELKIVYEDMYENRFLKEKDLKWFGRLLPKSGNSPTLHKK